MYEDGKKINELLGLAQENNVMLKRMQRARRFSSFFWVVKWVVIIAFAAGAYYYLQPFVESLQKVVPQLEGTFKSLPIPGWGSTSSTTPR